MNKLYLEKEISHSPVLRQSVKMFLALCPGDIAVDATLGLGGHTADMLESVGQKGHIYGFDQDQDNVEIACRNLAQYSHQFTPIHTNFEHLLDRLAEHDITQVSGILFDLGVASPHFDRPERGFSLQSDGPLDMRFDLSSGVQTAADLLRNMSVAELAKIFKEYGEERYALRIAHAIVDDRKKVPFKTTKQLAELIVRLYPPRERHKKIHPATKVFQALRIAVNRELDVLENVLPQAVSLLKPGGRLVVVSYHSLEDRIVKHFLKSQARSCICSKEILQCQCRGRPVLKVLTKKPVVPSDVELVENPRSRSAKLRCAEKL